MPHNLLDTLQPLKGGKFYSLPRLGKALGLKVERLPVSIRIVLESVLRNCDGKKITEAHVRQLAGWQANAARTEEIPFVLARIVLQDFTGVPLLCDLAAMRGVAQKMGKDPKVIEPLVPVDLVVDHSVQIDHYGTKNALDLNMKLEFKRNEERYQFMKWGMQAFDTFKVVPPGIGIVHQVNLEYLARGVHKSKDGIYYPDTLVGTDSHTTMINGIGVVGWGVGGIEAEAGMLGQPVYFLTPDVVGVNLKGKLHPACTATDLVLTVTEMLRKAKVVGKFVEFFGAGTESLSVTDRATIGNMAPEYGATMGFFPVDDKTLEYFRGTGRTDAEIDAFAAYFKAQGMFGVPRAGQIDYSQTLELDLSSVMPSLTGPKRPQDRIQLDRVKATFTSLFSKPVAENGFARKPEDLGKAFKAFDGTEVRHGDVLIAAITSCTNTSNPNALLAAGLLARKAVEKGLRPNARVKTSFAPGSKVVTAYLRDAGLLPYLEQLGFHVVAYGCTTCMGNAGPLDPALEEAVVKNDIVACAVLSGNRNFEARVHQSLKANFLMSPPLVVAFALAGTVLIDMASEPIGTGKDGKPVYLRDLWPSDAEIAGVLRFANNAQNFRREYGDLSGAKQLWDAIPESQGAVFQWQPQSTYILEPPFFAGFGMQPAPLSDIRGARALGIYGDSLTTDHISPVAPIRPTTPAGQWLTEHNAREMNTFGARRCNHEVMARGTFANVRIKNLMVPGSEGGVTIHQPSGEKLGVHEAAMRYRREGVPLVVFAGEEYGTGSSRDWAAKGPQMLGIRAVVARGFERIHRSNLIGMGILPCQFQGKDSVGTLRIDGTETFDLSGIAGHLEPMQDVALVIRRRDGTRTTATLTLRVDTAIEAEYLKHGGILHYVLRDIVAQAA
ncbi:MAG TPA: aconitate hydratase AcnA [Burkholderiales bacterium]|nr:aconitate hydratase AcnA [Burkholderiales bacterium]